MCGLPLEVEFALIFLASAMVLEESVRFVRMASCSFCFLVSCTYTQQRLQR